MPTLPARPSLEHLSKQAKRLLKAAKALAPDQMDPEQDHELLLEAAGNGNLPAVQTMIALGFELSPRGKRTPLHFAAYQGHLDVIKALVDAGADTALRDPHYHTPPFVHAMQSFKTEAAEYLKNFPMDILIAAAIGRTDHIKKALAQDESLVNARFRSVRNDTQDSFERDWAPPLWYAVMNGQL